jgi:aarF domain-containing kinase
VFKFWGSEEGDAVTPGQCMQELLEQVRRHKVNIDGNVCTVMVTTLVLEVLLHNPKLSFTQSVKPPKP